MTPNAHAPAVSRALKAAGLVPMPPNRIGLHVKQSGARVLVTTDYGTRQIRAAAEAILEAGYAVTWPALGENLFYAVRDTA